MAKDIVYDRKREAAAEYADQHKNREMESRDSEMRANQMRTILEEYNKNPYDITPPDGLEYLWVREHIRGELDTANLAELASKGWTAVPLSRHSERGGVDIYGNPVRDNDQIRRKGSLLCQRVKELGKYEREVMLKNSLAAIHTLPGVQFFQNEPGIIFKNTSTTISNNSATNNNWR
jgi:hypothetical protein